MLNSSSESSTEQSVGAVIQNVEALVRDLQQAEGSITSPDCSSASGIPGSDIADLQQSAGGPAPTLDARPRGFQVKATARPQWPAADQQGAGLAPPKPLPKRPTGRFFIGSILLFVCLTIAWLIWDAFLGVAAYGVVKGDTLNVSASFDGELTQIFVKEGQTVARGDLLATLRSCDFERELARLKDELVVEQARLDADSAKQLWESQAHAAEYFEMFGLLQKHREELSRLQRDVDRMDQIKDPTIIPLQEQDRMRFALAGQQELVEKMTAAIGELRKRTEAEGQPTPEDESVQLKPTLARVAYLKGEIARFEQQLREGELRSPCNGVVVRRHAAVGQRVTRMTTVLDVVDRDSLFVELFMPQDDVGSVKNGKELSISIESLGSVKCVIETGRECFEPAPNSICRFYKRDEPLLPVVLKPQLASSEQPLRIGAVTKLTLLQSYGWQ